MKTVGGIRNLDSRQDDGIRNRAELLMEHMAGYVAVRTIGIGFRHRLFEKLAAHLRSA